MRRILFALLVLIFAMQVSAEAFFTAEEIQAQGTINATANLSQSESSTLDYFEARLRFYPLEDPFQDVLSFETEGGIEEGNAIVYRWDSLQEQYPLSAKATTKTSYQYPKIKQKHDFPIPSIPDHVVAFTRPTPFIDSDNPEIKAQATAIIQGETDAYRAVFKIGAWVNKHINYSLNTLTEDVSQKSSWVLENEFGVCDEITSLFIALNRAVGIPARFVSGMAYTNYNDINDYGPHAWAEVYIGDQWIPFDITYGEYGFVDAGHIKMSVSDDAQTPSVEYTWRGTDISVTTDPIDIEIIPVKTTGTIEDKLDISASFAYSEIGFGSYNILEVQARNPHDYYVATELQTSKSQEMIFLDSSIPLLLEPSETKTVTFRTKIKEAALDSGFVYTFPVVAYTTENTSATATFQATENGKRYSLDDVNELISTSDILALNGSLSLTCSTKKDVYDPEEEITAECDLTNTGASTLENIDICLGDTCKTDTLNESESRKHSFTFTETIAGEKDRFFRAQHPDALAIDSITYLIADTPSIEITTITHPNSVEFSESFDLTFVLDKSSYSTPEEVEVTITIQSDAETWHVHNLTRDREITLTIPATSLKAGSNEIQIDVVHAEGSSSATTVIDLINVTYWQQFMLFLYHLF